MKNLDRSRNQVAPEYIQAHNQGRLREEKDNLKQQVEHAWQQLDAANSELGAVNSEREQLQSQQAELQRIAAEATAIARREQHQNQGLMHKLQEAIASRNSMRGKLGNMTAQRNKLYTALKTNVDRLTTAHQQVTRLQQEYDSDMAEFARVYLEMTPDQQYALPIRLRLLLEQVARDYQEQAREN